MPTVDIDAENAEKPVWILRGDAPPAPTLDQLSEPDAIITSLIGLPVALSRLMNMPERSGPEAA